MSKEFVHIDNAAREPENNLGQVVPTVNSDEVIGQIEAFAQAITAETP